MKIPDGQSGDDMLPHSSPVFTKLFGIRIKIRFKFKILLLCTFFKPTIII